MLVASQQQLYSTCTVVHIHAADIASKHLSEHRICALLGAAMQAFTVIVHICHSVCEQDELNSTPSRYSMQ